MNETLPLHPHSGILAYNFITCTPYQISLERSKQGG